MYELFNSILWSTYVNITATMSDKTIGIVYQLTNNAYNLNFKQNTLVYVKTKIINRD